MIETFEYIESAIFTEQNQYFKYFKSVGLDKNVKTI